MIEGMKKSFKNQVIDYGMKFNPKLTDIEMAKKLSDDGSWIAFILPKNSNVQHSIIIDKIIGNKVYVRDPWPLEKVFKDGNNGVEGIISLQDFEYSWRFAQNWCFRIIKK